MEPTNEGMNLPGTPSVVINGQDIGRELDAKTLVHALLEYVALRMYHTGRTSPYEIGEEVGNYAHSLSSLDKLVLLAFTTGLVIKL